MVLLTFRTVLTAAVLVMVARDAVAQARSRGRKPAAHPDAGRFLLLVNPVSAR